MAVSGFLVEVEKTRLEELRAKYPEAFARPYHKDAGLVAERVIMYDGSKRPAVKPKTRE